LASHPIFLDIFSSFSPVTSCHMPCLHNEWQYQVISRTSTEPCLDCLLDATLYSLLRSAKILWPPTPSWTKTRILESSYDHPMKHMNPWFKRFLGKNHPMRWWNATVKVPEFHQLPPWMAAPLPPTWRFQPLCWPGKTEGISPLTRKKPLSNPMILATVVNRDPYDGVWLKCPHIIG